MGAPAKIGRLPIYVGELTGMVNAPYLNKCFYFFIFFIFSAFESNYNNKRADRGEVEFNFE